MNIFSGLIGVVMAAETLLSPMVSDVTAKVGNLANPGQTRAPVSELGKLLSFVPPTPVVLGLATDSAALATPSSLLATSSAQKILDEVKGSVRRTKKPNVIVALLGDSMTDTLGPEALPLKNSLGKTYPKTKFTVKNFGVGGENIDSAIKRITDGYTYLGVSYPSLSSISPDVVVIESCGYNPYSFDAGAVDTHWLALASAVDTVKRNVPKAKIVIAATIAPNATVFGDGAAGLSFSAQDKQERVAVIKKYLESTIRFAKSEGYPLADAYTPSLDRNGNGKLTYINPGDHIHYSDAGRSFFSGKVADAITANRLIE